MEIVNGTDSGSQTLSSMAGQTTRTTKSFIAGIAESLLGGNDLMSLGQTAGEWIGSTAGSMIAGPVGSGIGGVIG